MAASKDFTRNPAKYLYDKKEGVAAAAEIVQAGVPIDARGLRAVAQAAQATIVVLSYNDLGQGWTTYVIEPWKQSRSSCGGRKLVWLRFKSKHYTWLNAKDELRAADITSVLEANYCNAIKFEDINRDCVPLQGGGHLTSVPDRRTVLGGRQQQPKDFDDKCPGSADSAGGRQQQRKDLGVPYSLKGRYKEDYH